MYKQSPTIFDRLSAIQGGYLVERWGSDSIGRFERFCFDKAPTCACGCGEKTIPNSDKSIEVWFSMYNRFGLEPSFAKFVNGHQTLTCPANYKPTREQHQAILASIIGDGYLSYPYKNNNPMARIVWNMGDRKHAEHKLKFFEFLGARMTIKPNAGWGKTMYSVVTKSHPLLTSYMKEYRDQHGNKKVQKIVDELDWFGWAWLYGDDGHLGFRKNVNGYLWTNVYIHSEGYGKEGTQMYIDALARLLGSADGIDMKVYTGGQPTKTRYCVRMKNEPSKKFIAGVAPYMANGMEYKIHGH